MNVLALDLAISVGWAAMIDGELSSGTKAFPLGLDEPRGLRYVRFADWLGLRALHPSTGTPHVSLIVYEFPHQRGRSATVIGLGLVAQVEAFGATHGIEIMEGPHTSTLKKWLTGNGHAKKPEMMATVSAKYKVTFDEDEADAIALLYHALAEGEK